MTLTMAETALRLFLAIILGGAVGFEREREHMAAGLRTHMLVSLGACLAVLVGLEAFGNGSGSANLVQGLITGIGFLGAGAILHYGGRIKGLTTAASLWLVCLVGIAVGFGFYFGALVATIATTLLLLLRDDMFVKGGD